MLWLCPTLFRPPHANQVAFGAPGESLAGLALAVLDARAHAGEDFLRESRGLADFKLVENRKLPRTSRDGDIIFDSQFLVLLKLLFCSSLLFPNTVFPAYSNGAF
jgi:hypothetical protein